MKRKSVKATPIARASARTRKAANNKPAKVSLARSAQPTTAKRPTQKQTPGHAANTESPSAVPGRAMLLDLQDKHVGFSIVAIGASAGGLDAVQQFFDHTPADSGNAFVIVQHHAPDYEDGMVPLLKRHTAMAVIHVKQGMALAPNTIYLAPAGLYLSIVGGNFHCIKPEPAGRLRMPIDFFFRALVQDCGERAICIVLSGTGTDGTLGLRATKSAGGMTMAQDSASAAYGSMPESAVASGSVDYVLPPTEMPRRIARFIEHPYIAASTQASDVTDHLEKVFSILRTHTGHDFTHYKRNTIIRRIERRMAVNQLVHMVDYVRYLEKTKHEATALFKEFLISVTGFFRDADAFVAVVAKALPNLLADRSQDKPLRLWVPGCATGEEAYTLAILLQEELHRLGNGIKVQIFATDIDTDALDFARVGLYPESIALDVTAPRLQQFFTHEGHAYRIKKSIREMVTFAQQNILQDPPFSKLDLIACRNLLIYFDRTLQQRLFPLFHYVLSPHGYLLLGLSESVSEFSDLFMPVDKKWKLFQRKGARRDAASFPPDAAVKFHIDPPRPEVVAGKEPTIAEIAEKHLLAEHVPACVVVDAKCNVVLLYGPTGEFLEMPSGAATFNVLKMIRAELRIDLRSALHVAFKKGQKTVRSAVVIKKDSKSHLIDLIVKPFTGGHTTTRDLMMVIFADAPPAVSGAQAKGKRKTKAASQPMIDQRVLDLEDELSTAKDSLLFTIVEVETTNEELQSTNEELQSTNEELQSTNEELETSKEELQSINEEVVTVNSELQGKIDELSQATSDMVNMLSSTRIGTVFIDNRLRIKRFTPVSGEIMNLIPSDVGRPIGHIVPNLAYDGFAADVGAVLKTLKPKQEEVKTRDGVCYLMRILPYRTMENIVDGVIVSFIDISGLQQANLAAAAALKYAAPLVEIVQQPLLALNRRYEVVLANAAYYRVFRAQPAETEGRIIFDLDHGRFNLGALKKLLQETLAVETPVEKFPLAGDFSALDIDTVTVNARRAALDPAAAGGQNELIFLVFDVAQSSQKARLTAESADAK